MNRFRFVRRVSGVFSVQVLSLAFVACQGEVRGSLTYGDGEGTSSSGSGSESVENPRTTDTSVSSVSGTTPLATSTVPTNASTTAPPAFPSSTQAPTTVEPTSSSDEAWSSPAPISSETFAEAATSSEVTEAVSSDTQESNGPPAFDIALEFLSSANQVSEEVRSSFLDAEAFWENVIVGDLPDVELRFEQACVPDQGAYVQGVIDDLHIFVAARDIDGVDGVLGAAGPCLSHSSRNNLPVAGYMEFDTADLQRYADEGRLDEIIIHEMGHVLGFGGMLWTFPQDSLGGEPFLADPTDLQGNDPSPRDTHFVGPHAMAEFDAIGGSLYSGAKVPVENVGGQGTANGHWREEVMGNELMTSFMTNREGVLSTVTIAALEDMGYTVNYEAADNYVWPPPDERGGGFLRAGDELSPIDFGNDILQVPVRNIED